MTINRWVVAAVLWICVIFFSSTSLASRWAEGSFSLVGGFFLSSLASDPSCYGIVHLLADKGYHVSLFCILACLLWKAFAAQAHRSWLILLAGAVVGSCSEFLQNFFPDRDPAVRDVLINIGGVALGLLLCRLLFRSSHRSEHAQRPVPSGVI